MDPAQCCNWNLKKIVYLLSAAVVLMIFWNWVSSPMIVTVTGKGEVNVPATNATVTFSLSATDTTSQAAILSVSTSNRFYKFNV